MKTLLRRTAAAATCVLFTAAGSYAQTVELKPQWIVGKRYTQQMRMNQQSTIAMAGQKMEQGMNMEMDTVMTVTQHEDPSMKRLKVKYDRMSMMMNMNGQQMGFDSSKPGGNDPLGLGKGLGGMIGKEFSVIMGADGKVKDVEKLDELLGSIDLGPAGAQMKQMFSKENFAQMIEQAGLHNFPQKPVAPGATWPLTFSMPMPGVGNIAIKGTYTYKGMTQRGGVPTAEILTDAKLEFDFKPGGTGEQAAAIQQMGMRFEGGKMSGSTFFDPKIGTARGMEMNQEMTMKMNNPADPSQGIEVPIKQKITMDLVKFEDAK